MRKCTMPFCKKPDGFDLFGFINCLSALRAGGFRFCGKFIAPPDRGREILRKTTEFSNFLLLLFTTYCIMELTIYCEAGFCVGEHPSCRFQILRNRPTTRSGGIFAIVR